jgi:hypothetical protein
MYGVIFQFLREYVTEHHGGEDTWQALLDDNGYGYRLYFATGEYPDEEIVALAGSAAKLLGMPLPAVLEGFGTYVGPRLVNFYHGMVRGNWKTLDVVEHAGSRIHDALHEFNPSRKPPRLVPERHSEHELTLRYHSHRKLCPVVRGILRGLADHYGESIEIQETQCMHQGAKECVFQVSTQPA